MRRRSFIALAASLPLLPRAGTVTADPSPVPVDDDSGLATLLRLLPAAATGERGIIYANYAAQRAALSITETGAAIDSSAWFSAMSNSLMIPGFMPEPLDPRWRDGLGFDLRDVAQMVHAVDRNIVIFSGQFDAAVLTAAWEAGGYAPVDTGGVTWYTLGADNVLFDPNIPLSNWHLGALGHLALLDGGTVVGTAERVVMEQVLALHAGEGPSFAEGAGAILTAAAPATIAAGWIIDGMALVTVGDGLSSLVTNPNVPADEREQLATAVAETAAEVSEEGSRMPPIAMALIGITAGVATSLTAEAFPHGPTARALVVVVPADVANAETVAETAHRRLATLAIPELASDGGGRPYAEEFPSIVIRVTSSGAVVIELERAPEVPAGRLIELQQMGLLSFLFWAG